MARKEVIISLAIIAALATVIVVIGVALVTWTNSGNVLESGTVTFTLDTVAWDNDPMVWGDLHTGDVVTKAFDVNNDKNVDVTVVLSHTAPTGITLVWSLDGSTIPMKTVSTGTLTLTVADNVIPGSFSFTATVDVT
jgi:hypothetical protein